MSTKCLENWTNYEPKAMEENAPRPDRASRPSAGQFFEDDELIEPESGELEFSEVGPDEIDAIEEESLDALLEEKEALERKADLAADDRGPEMTKHDIHRLRMIHARLVQAADDANRWSPLDRAAHSEIMKAHRRARDAA